MSAIIIACQASARYSMYHVKLGFSCSNFAVFNQSCVVTVWQDIYGHGLCRFVVLLYFSFEWCRGWSTAVRVNFFLSFSPSPFGPMSALWVGAVVAKRHPGHILRFLGM